MLKKIHTDYVSTDGKYSILVACANCDERNFINIAKGRAISTVACPNCGCKMLRKYP